MSADDVVRRLVYEPPNPADLPALIAIAKTLPWFFDLQTWRSIETLDDLADVWQDWVREYQSQHPVIG